MGKKNASEFADSSIKANSVSNYLFFKVSIMLFRGVKAQNH
jgi:hypothetical protein